MSLIIRKKNVFHVFFSILAYTLFSPASIAHFDPGTKIRYFVLTEIDHTTEIYIRTPIPLVFADILNGETDVHGFIFNAGTNDRPRLFLSANQIEKNRAAFATRLNNSLQWSVGLQKVPSRVRAYRVLQNEPELRLLSSGTARHSLSSRTTTNDVPISDGYIDMLVSVASVSDKWPLRVQASLPRIELREDVRIDNHVVDERSGQRRIYSRQGQLERTLSLPRSFIGWVMEYIYQGILHILEGTDHVLLVLAMALGATRKVALIRAVTAFTVGHSITLVAGFLGYAPAAAWFIPAIEALIALTILAAIVEGLFLVRHIVFIYVAIGLLHGFGFSFVLGNVLGRDSADIFPALVAFTIGIELGQLAIVALVLIALLLIRKTIPKVEFHLRRGVLIAIGVVACFMMVERVPLLLTA